MSCHFNFSEDVSFEPQPLKIMSKRRCGYPSETKVKVSVQVVHGGKLLME